MTQSSKKSTTQQVAQTRDEKGRITGGMPPVGFHTNPENRSPGGWDKTQTISYQYNRIGRMSDKELAEFVPENQFQEIAYRRILAAKSDSGLNDTKEITDRTEGKAPQTLDVSNSDGSMNPYANLTLDELKKLAG